MSSSYFSDLDATEEIPANQEEKSYFSDLPKEPSRLRSLISAPFKGLIKGSSKFSPLPSFGPVSPELGMKITEQLLPTQQKAPEEILEFTAENAPLSLFGEGGLAKKGLQAVSGALAKKGAKDIGLPEWAQDLISGFGMSAPDIAKGVAKKTISPSLKQKSIVDYLRGKGLSEEQITPIIQDKKKLSFFSKAASKFEKKDPFIKGIKEKIGSIFEEIREKGSQSDFLEGKKLYDFEDAFDQTLEKVPRMYRKIIEPEVKDLKKNPINFKELHDFNKAINAMVRDVEGGKAAIGILKEPIEKAMKSLSPELYAELKQANNVYSRLNNFTDKMTKKNWDTLINMGQAGHALIGILTLNPVMLKTAGLAAISKIAAKQILTNPRLQGIHKKMWEAFLKNKIPQALKYAELVERSLVENSEHNE